MSDASPDLAQDAPPEQPQLYLILPPAFELSSFPDLLSRVLDTREVACLRLALATQDQDRISRAADSLRDLAHARDLALVIADHSALVAPLGLDGVHLSDGSRALRSTRKELGEDAIIGAFCAASRHDGMTAAETGADYVAFGPSGPTALGHGDAAPRALFDWWSEVIEVPVVAEGALDIATIEALAPITDFFGIGPEIWDTQDPVAAFKALTAPLD